MAGTMTKAGPWRWRSSDIAETFEQWLVQAAESKNFDHAEEAIRKSWLVTWLKDKGDVFAAEQVRNARSCQQLLDRTKGEGAVPIILPVEPHLQEFLSVGVDLYTSNAFRLTGLPVAAKGIEISRYLDKLKMQEKLGVKGGRHQVHFR